MIRIVQDTDLADVPQSTALHVASSFETVTCTSCCRALEFAVVAHACMPGAHGGFGKALRRIRATIVTVPFSLSLRYTHQITQLYLGAFFFLFLCFVAK